VKLMTQNYTSSPLCKGRVREGMGKPDLGA
jgi:hypothetical protein